MPYDENAWDTGEERRPEGGPSFRGTVFDVLANKIMDAEEVKNKVEKKLGLTDLKMQKVSTALNNLYRDGKVLRKYVEGKAIFRQAAEEAPAEEAPVE